MWAVLRELGAEGVRARIRRHIGFADRLASLVDDDPRLELVVPPSLSICCFRYRGRAKDHAQLDALNADIVRRLRAETPFVPSTTRIEGHLILRACSVNPASSSADADGLAEAVAAIGDRLSA